VRTSLRMKQVQHHAACRLNKNNSRINAFAVNKKESTLSTGPKHINLRTKKGGTDPGLSPLFFHSPLCKKLFPYKIDSVTMNLVRGVVL
jgi:hypothetical protein